MKILSRALLLSSIFATSAFSEVDEAMVKALMDQVKALSEEVASLKAQMKSSDAKVKKAEHVAKKAEEKAHIAHEKVAHAVPVSPAAVHHGPSAGEVKITAEASKKKARPGYIEVPGSNMAIKFGGLIKMDAIQDTRAPSGDASNLPGLPLDGFSANTSRYNKFSMHPRQSRLNFATIAGTDIGDIGTFFEFDFFNGNNFASIRSAQGSTSNYTPRMRHAYFTVDQGSREFLVGQTWTTFFDQESNGTTVEFNNVSSQSGGRQPQIRYTQRLTDRWKAAIALENSLTDYTDSAGVLRDDGSSVAGSDGFQNLPDLVAALKYDIPEKLHFTIRGLLRQLRVKRNSVSPAVMGSKTAYGVGVSGKVFYQGKSGIFAQINAGEGIGRYIFDAVGQSAAFDTNTGRFATQMGYGLILGVEHYWHEKWRSNLILGQTLIRVAKFQRRDVANPVTKRMGQLILNIIYSPVKNMDIGFEYARYIRKAYGRTPNVAAGSNPTAFQIYTGVAHRFQLGFSYKF